MHLTSADTSATEKQAWLGAGLQDAQATEQEAGLHQTSWLSPHRATGDAAS